MPKRIWRLLADLIARQSIRHKILWIVMPVIVLSSLSTGVYYYFRTTAYVEDVRTTNFVELMNQSQVSFDNIFAGVEDATKSITLNSAVEGLLLRTDMARYTLAQQIDDYALLSRYIATSNTNVNIRILRLYFIHHSIYTRERQHFFQVADAEKKQWYERALFVGGAPVWSYDGGELVCARAIMRYELAQSECGFIEAVVDPRVAQQVIESVIATTGGNICLMDDLGRVVWSRGSEAAAFSDLALRHWEKWRLLDGTLNLETGDVDAMIDRKPLTNGWSIIASLPYQAIRAEIRALSYEVVYISLIAIALATALVMLFTGRFTRRVRRIVGFMSLVDIHSDDYLREKADDELTSIERNFNKMLYTARESVRKEKEALRLKREADFDILQEQINPHFLYNCLDAINWLAIESHVAGISEMTTLLSRFFRLGLSRGNQIITLSDELQHVRIYMEIMKKRFDGHLELIVDAALDPSAHYTLKCVLQPLVENAILRGISNRADQRGLIRIACRAEDETLVLTVEDDGAGIPEAQLQTLRRVLAEGSAEAGFGLNNVNQRIRLHFGEAYGLTIESEAGRGTAVTLRLPGGIRPEREEGQVNT